EIIFLAYIMLPMANEVGLELRGGGGRSTHSLADHGDKPPGDSSANHSARQHQRPLPSARHILRRASWSTLRLRLIDYSLAKGDAGCNRGHRLQWGHRVSSSPPPACVRDVGCVN